MLTVSDWQDDISHCRASIWCSSIDPCFVQTYLEPLLSLQLPCSLSVQAAMCAGGEQASPNPFYQPQSCSPGARPRYNSALVPLGIWPACVGASRLFLSSCSPLGCVTLSILSSCLGLLSTSRFPSYFTLIYTRSRACGPLLGCGSTASSIRCISKHDFHLSVSRYS